MSEHEKAKNASDYLMETGPDSIPWNKTKEELIEYKKLMAEKSNGTNTLQTLHAAVRGADSSSNVHSVNNSIHQNDENVKHKNKQFEIIEKYNPAPDEYHTWIRSSEDIKTFEEALADEDWSDGSDFDPDYTWDMAQDALMNGEMEARNVQSRINMSESELRDISKMLDYNDGIIIESNSDKIKFIDNLKKIGYNKVIAERKARQVYDNFKNEEKHSLSGAVGNDSERRSDEVSFEYDQPQAEREVHRTSKIQEIDDISDNESQISVETGLRYIRFSDAEGKSQREILAEALKDSAVSEHDKKVINEYLSSIGEIEKMERYSPSAKIRSLHA